MEIFAPAQGDSGLRRWMEWMILRDERGRIEKEGDLEG